MCYSLLRSLFSTTSPSYILNERETKMKWQQKGKLITIINEKKETIKKKQQQQLTHSLTHSLRNNLYNNKFVLLLSRIFKCMYEKTLHL